MSLVSDVLIGRAEKYVGHELTSAEKDDFRRMSELIGREDDDFAWSLILAMWAARFETTIALRDARDDVHAGLEAWMERVRIDMETIDEKRRSSTREAAAEAERSAAAIHRAAGQGTAILSARLEELEGKVATMTATVNRAMADATGALAAADKRDIEVEKQVRTLAERYARHLTEKLEARADSALKSAESRLGQAAEQAKIAARPLLVSFSVLLFGVFVGSMTTWIMFKWIIPR